MVVAWDPVLKDSPRHPLHLFESTPAGVGSYQLGPRLNAYADGFVDTLAVRKLMLLDDANAHSQMEKLKLFARNVRGRPFNFSFAKLFASKMRPRGISSTGARRRGSSICSLDEQTIERFCKDNEELEGFFCSELVAGT